MLPFLLRANFCLRRHEGKKALSNKKTARILQSDCDNGWGAKENIMKLKSIEKEKFRSLKHVNIFNLPIIANFSKLRVKISFPIKIYIKPDIRNQ